MTKTGLRGGSAGAGVVAGDAVCEGVLTDASVSPRPRNASRGKSGDKSATYKIIVISPGRSHSVQVYSTPCPPPHDPNDASDDGQRSQQWQRNSEQQCFESQAGFRPVAGIVLGPVWIGPVNSHPGFAPDRRHKACSEWDRPDWRAARRSQGVCGFRRPTPIRPARRRDSGFRPVAGGLTFAARNVAASGQSIFSHAAPRALAGGVPGR